MQYMKQYKPQESGVTELAGTGELSHIEFSIINLKPGASHRATEEQKETGIILLQGRGSIDIGSEKSSISRKNVFEEKPTGAYVPPGIGWSIEAETAMELAWARTRSEKKSAPALIQPDKIEKLIRGKKTYRREIYNIIDEGTDAGKLLIGETINFPGEWSSFPPHKHDEENLPHEAKLEEVYLFKIQPENGFGLARLYTNNQEIDEALLIKNNSFLLIPRGYHPISAIPGHKLYYLWVLAGEQRELVPNEDPSYAWVNE